MSWSARRTHWLSSPRRQTDSAPTTRRQTPHPASKNQTHPSSKAPRTPHPWTPRRQTPRPWMPRRQTPHPWTPPHQTQSSRSAPQTDSPPRSAPRMPHRRPHRPRTDSAPRLHRQACQIHPLSTADPRYRTPPPESLPRSCSDFPAWLRSSAPWRTTCSAPTTPYPSPESTGNRRLRHSSSNSPPCATWTHTWSNSVYSCNSSRICSSPCSSTNTRLAPATRRLAPATRRLASPPRTLHRRLLLLRTPHRLLRTPRSPLPRTPRSPLLHRILHRASRTPTSRPPRSRPRVHRTGSASPPPAAASPTRTHRILRRLRTPSRTGVSTERPPPSSALSRGRV